MNIETTARLYLLWRDLGLLLNDAQPGLTLPLPAGDPNEVDAMKVHYVADQIRRGLYESK